MRMSIKKCAKRLGSGNLCMIKGICYHFLTLFVIRDYQKLGMYDINIGRTKRKI
jgi:hypothetical protein